MKGVSKITDVPCNLRNESKSDCIIPCTERYDVEKVSFIGSKLRDTFPTEMKYSKYLEEF